MGERERSRFARGSSSRRDEFHRLVTPIEAPTQEARRRKMSRDPLKHVPSLLSCSNKCLVLFDPLLADRRFTRQAAPGGVEGEEDAISKLNFLVIIYRITTGTKNKIARELIELIKCRLALGISP